MEIHIKRFAKGKEYSVGWMYIDGYYICDTLEDKVRELPEKCPYTPKWQSCKCKEKVYAETAIPAGEYTGRVSYSPAFKRYLIEIMNVPHFLGIRVHGGNHKDHTEGCILVGEYTDNGWLSNSQKTLTKVHDIVKSKLKDKQFNEKGGNFKIIIS